MLCYGKVFSASLGKSTMSVPLGFGLIFNDWVTHVLNCTFYTSLEFFSEKELYLESKVIDLLCEII